MKKVLFSIVLLLVAGVAYAATITNYTTKTGDTINGLAVVPGQVIQVLGPDPVPPPVPTPTPGEISVPAYTTGYGYPDNTPASSDISNGVLHTKAGGTGSYADPITLAVGHSIINGVDILDYKAGTIWYAPFLKKYFIVEDTCGDGHTPQNGPCHKITGNSNGNNAPAGSKIWLDLWIGGTTANRNTASDPAIKCEDAITAVHTMIQNPAATYPVILGPVYSGTSCATQF